MPHSIRSTHTVEIRGFTSPIRCLLGVLAMVLSCVLPPHANATTDLPAPQNCTLPCIIHLTGTSSGTPDPEGAFTIVVRGFSGSPIAGAYVSVDFSECSDLEVCATQAAVNPRCDLHGVASVTNLAGVASFRIVGAANNPSGRAPGYALSGGCGTTSAGCAVVWADGVRLGRMAVSAYDEDGAGGVNVPDVSLWLSDALGETYFARSDHDGNGLLTPPDLSSLLNVLLVGGSRNSCTGYCQ